MKQYEEQKEAVEKQTVINSFIEEHKVVVEQSQRDARSKEGQTALRDMIIQSLGQKKEVGKAPQVKSSVSREIGFREI